MYKTTILLVIAALCHFLKSKAQEIPDKQQLRPIAIGQSMPELTLTNVHQYPSKTLNLADLEAKLIILDFWATWCSPCISMIPKLDSLQKAYKGDLQIVSVTDQDSKTVLPFLQNWNSKGRPGFSFR